jgi:hypothetical protein
MRKVMGQYGHLRSEWRVVSRTSFGAVFALPGALAPNQSVWRKFSLWKLCAVFVLLSLAVTGAVVFYFDGGLVGVMASFAIVAPFTVGGVVLFWVFMGLFYSVSFSWGQVRRVVLCDPGVAVMTVEVPRQVGADEHVVLQPRNFLAVQRGEGRAMAMVKVLQANILADGNITIKAKAQNEYLADNYYVAKLNFRRGHGRWVYFP